MRTSLSSLPFIIAILLCFIQCEKEQDPNKPVDIPDVEFLNALIEAGVDINGDGIISYGEAEKVTVINLDPPEDSIGRRIGKISNLIGSFYKSGHPTYLLQSNTRTGCFCKY